MLMRANQSVLLLIDLQEKLFPAIDAGEQVLEHCRWLVELAGRMQVPTILTEQYPKGLGRTLSELREAASQACVVEKLHFSAVTEGKLVPAAAGRRQYIVGGTEAHVCVLQTVLDLLGPEHDVFVVEEAIGSRKPSDKVLAIARMRQHGAVIVSREMVAFEWLQKADSEQFREISRAMIK